MSKNEQSYLSSEQQEMSLVPVEGDNTPYQQTMDDLKRCEDLIAIHQNLGRVAIIRQDLEDEYGQQLAHQRRIMQPQPNKQDDPEGYAMWIESRDYISRLARQDLQTAIIVKRLATPLDQKINGNQPPAAPHLNRQGYLVDGFGKDFDDPKEDEFATLTKELEVMTGVATPLNRFEIRDILEVLGQRIYDTYKEIAYADLEFACREGGEVFDSNGNSHSVEPDPEQQRQYDEIEAKVAREVEQIKQVMGRYVNLLPADERETCCKQYRLRS